MNFVRRLARLSLAVLKPPCLLKSTDFLNRKSAYKLGREKKSQCKYNLMIPQPLYYVLIVGSCEPGVTDRNSEEGYGLLSFECVTCLCRKKMSVFSSAFHVTAHN